MKTLCLVLLSLSFGLPDAEAGNRRVRHLNHAQAGATVHLDARFITGLAAADPVDTWSARAGSSINATGTTTARPLYQPTGLNGLPALDFDGSNDRMTLSGALGIFRNIGSGYILAVAKDDAPSSGDTNHGVVVALNNSTSFRLGLLTRVNSNTGQGGAWRRLDGAALAYTAAHGDASSPHVCSVVADWSGNSLIARINGVAGTSQTASSGAGVTSDTDSSAINIGCRSASTDAINGQISLVSLFSPAPNAATILRLEQSAAFSFRISQ